MGRLLRTKLEQHLKVHIRHKGIRCLKGKRLLLSGDVHPLRDPGVPAAERIQEKAAGNSDLETVKTIYAFTPFGKGTANEANAAYPWSTFNGTDEDNERGVGTIWTEDGSFFYRIDQGGTTRS